MKTTGKKQKKSGRQPKSVDIDAPEPAKRQTGLLDNAIEELRAQLEVITKRRQELAAGHFDPELAAAAASLVRVILRAETEQRARDEDKLTADAVCAWLADADDDDRDAVARALEAGAGSLL